MNMMKMKINNLLTIVFCFAFLSCNSQIKKEEKQSQISNNQIENNNYKQFDTTTRTIHIFVALCDNKYQGIVPVPAKIGNGQDPANNLYWGCGYGIRTFFKNSKEWKLIKTRKINSIILERLVFKHKTKNYYLVADAYDGEYIKECTEAFLRSSSGLLKDTIQVDKTIIGISGNSKLITYIGHDGLMDFQLSEKFKNIDNIKRDVIILACYSKSYFSPHLKTANINPIIWTSGLMCPEAYTIHDAIIGYVNNETNEGIRNRAAAAYSTYQKCSVKAAKKLLISNW
jgi:hypothetical protein